VNAPSVDDAKVGRVVGRCITTERNSVMISDSRRYYNAQGNLRRDRDSTDPSRGVLLKASDRKCSPRIVLAICEENVGRVHVPPAVNFVESADVGLRGDRSLWESAQALLLKVIQSRELRLDASVVVRISTLEETYMGTSN
jgi:hypothetical protein